MRRFRLPKTPQEIRNWTNFSLAFAALSLSISVVSKTVEKRQNQARAVEIQAQTNSLRAQIGLKEREIRQIRAKRKKLDAIAPR